MGKDQGRIGHFTSKKAEEEFRIVYNEAMALFMHNSKKAVEQGKRYVKDVVIENRPDASHAINGGYPDEINRRILEFLETVMNLEIHQFSVLLKFSCSPKL
jgi:hypothetical protein